jgi:hypothetical protein
MPAAQGRIKRSFGAHMAAFAVALIGLGVFASAAEAVPGTFWGVVPQSTPTEEQLRELKGGGVDSIRIPVGWNVVQANPGAPYDWSTVDETVKNTALAGIEALPTLGSPPSWAVPSVYVPGTHRAIKAPSHLPVSGSAGAAWKLFIQAAVARYGPQGSFWAENPLIPKRPMRIWQIWNEENFEYFVARPNPAEYGKLVTASAAAIKGVDPGAQILLGGLFARPKEALLTRKPPLAYFATDFLELMYKSTPGIKAKFNSVALHPYTTRYQELAPDIEELRSVLARNHDAGKGLWITELGWSSKPASSTNNFAKGPAGQAAQLEGAFSLLEHKQVKWKVKRVFWFSVDDQAETCNFCDGSGLFGPGFRPKKAWYSYVKFAGGTP